MSLPRCDDSMLGCAMSTANAELRRPTGIGCSELLDSVMWFWTHFQSSRRQGRLIVSEILLQRSRSASNPNLTVVAINNDRCVASQLHCVVSILNDTPVVVIENPSIWLVDCVPGINDTLPTAHQIHPSLCQYFCLLVRERHNAQESNVQNSAMPDEGCQPRMRNWHGQPALAAVNC